MPQDGARPIISGRTQRERGRPVTHIFLRDDLPFQPRQQAHQRPFPLCLHDRVLLGLPAPATRPFGPGALANCLSATVRARSLPIHLMTEVLRDRFGAGPAIGEMEPRRFGRPDFAADPDTRTALAIVIKPIGRFGRNPADLRLPQANRRACPRPACVKSTASFDETDSESTFLITVDAS